MIDKAVRKDIIEYRKEIKELKEEIQRQSKALCINDELLVDYKQRIDKAIEFINEYKPRYNDYYDRYNYLDFEEEDKQELLKILGGDK